MRRFALELTPAGNVRIRRYNIVLSRPEALDLAADIKALLIGSDVIADQTAWRKAAEPGEIEGGVIPDAPPVPRTNTVMAVPEKRAGRPEGSGV